MYIYIYIYLLLFVYLYLYYIFAVLGETCMNLGECYETCNQDRIVCRNGKCACTWGYMKSNSSVCVKHPQDSKFFLKGK